MKYYLLFAWRNLWRNKRRTLLATSSIFFAVLLALLMRSLQFGQYEYMVQTTVSLFTGHLQVQGKGYWDDRSFDESFVVTDSLTALLQHHPNITTWNPRIESVTLVSHKLETRISPVIGIHPEKEAAMTGLQKRVVKGNYLVDSSSGIMIAEGLAERLKAGVGDSVVLFGQGYQGVNAAEQLMIEGIVRFPIPQLNNAMVFLALGKAQTLFNAENRLTSIALMIDDAKQMKSIQADLSATVNSNLVVMNWEEMTPEIVQAIEADNASGMIMLLILYVVIGFGVFGTVMMMTIERTREFGLLISLGMKRGRLLLVTTLEAIFVSMIGAVAGILGALPVILYFYYHPIHVTGDLADVYLAYGMEPIIPVSSDPSIFISQTILVFFIALITSCYPLLFIRTLHPVRAMQGRGGPRR